MRKLAFIIFFATILPVLSYANETDKTINIMASPLDLIAGYINLDATFKLSNIFALGPTISYRNLPVFKGPSTADASVKVFAIGARGTWFKNGTFTDGLYLSPIIQYGNATATISVDSGYAIVTTALVGYHWFWESLNICLGGGYGINAYGSSSVKVSDGTGQNTKTTPGGFVLDFKFGFVF